MYQIVLSERVFRSANRIAESRHMSVGEVVEELIVEEAAMEAMRQDELRKTLEKRQRSVAAGEANSAAEVFDRLEAKYRLGSETNARE